MRHAFRDDPRESGHAGQAGSIRGRCLGRCWVDATVVCELQGSLFFGTTDLLFTEVEADLRRARFLILDLRRVRSVDLTGVHLLEQIAAALAEHDGCLLVSRLPASLPSGRNLREYLAQAGMARSPDATRTFATLDDALRWTEDRVLAEELPHRATDESPLALAEIHLLREFAADGTLAGFASCVEERPATVGTEIFQAGSGGDELFLIRRGTVRAVLALNGGGYHNLAFFSRGDFFGEVAFLDRGVRSAGVVALTDVDLFVVSRSRFDAACRTHAALGTKLFARLAGALAMRLRQADHELRALYEA